MQKDKPQFAGCTFNHQAKVKILKSRRSPAIFILKRKSGDLRGVKQNSISEEILGYDSYFAAFGIGRISIRAT